MEWGNCYNPGRIGDNKLRKDMRSQYIRDYDKIIFSSPFRRLQDKTQVFPLPGTSFVHNRHTHSLEVASVGRSLATLTGDFIAEELIDPADTTSDTFYRQDLASVISAACLSHDIGNPAFGHSGEDAISEFFISAASLPIEGTDLRDFFTEDEWNDLINFEGNANAFRIMTKVYKGKSPFGMGITLSTLTAMMKYPCSSSQTDKSYKHRKKYGFFKAEKEAFAELAMKTNMVADPNCPGAFMRHPFVYLVEAADDICYNIIDMEDAHRIGILTTKETSEAFLNLINEIEIDKSQADRSAEIFNKIEDANESIAFLRSVLINVLVRSASDHFKQNHAAILSGHYNGSLLGDIMSNSQAFKHIVDLSVNRIYKSPSVIEVELAGFHVMSELLKMYVVPALKTKKSHKDISILSMVPSQFTGELGSGSPYEKVMNILDHISSMTDAYALEHYRRMKGIEIKRHD